MPVSIYEIAWIFVIYAFLGWCTEVAYAALDTGKFVNRGFLNGPMCPVYGCGVLVVIMILTPLKEHFLILFAGSVILTTVIEFITGFLLEKLFHNQWWDYSNQPFNICGYVCLKFSILWGIACTLIMDVIHPTIYELIQILPKIPGIALLVICCIVFGVDLVITVSTILKFNQRLKLLDEIAVKLKSVSNEIGENIYEGVATVIEKSDDFRETVEIKSAEFTENHGELAESFSNLKESFSEKKEEWAESLENMKNAIGEKKDGITGSIKDSLEERRAEKARLQKEYNEVLEKRNAGEKRLMKAFPAMRAKGHEESFGRLKKYLEEKRSDK